MNKFFTKIAALSVGLAMAIGVGVAVGSKGNDVAKADATPITTTINYAAESITGNTNGTSYVAHRNTQNFNGTTVYFGGTYAVQSSSFAMRSGKTPCEMIGNIDPSFDSSASWKNNIPSGAVGAIPGAITQIAVTVVNDDSVNRGFKLSLGTSQIVTNSSYSGGTAYSGSSASGTGYTYNSSTRTYTISVAQASGYNYFAISANNSKYTGVKSIAITYEPVSSDPVISSVSLSKGNPTASEVKAGGTSWTMAATVATTPADDTTLSRNVNWSCSPTGAVTFSKTTSASAEDITVTAVNTARASVTITATSAQTSGKYATSNTFSISKSYEVNTNTLVTKDGESEYDAGGSTSKVVTFTSTLTYSGDAGAYGVNLSVSPSSGASLDASITSSASGKDFDVTFTKDGTYTVTATPVENEGKAASVTVSISGVVIPGYELATSTSALRNNSKVIIHSSGETYKRFMTDSASDYRNMSSSNYTVSDNFIPEADLPSGTEILTLVTSGSHWNLKTHDNKYLSLTNAENKLYTVSSLDGTSTQWDISFTGNNADITSVAQSARTIRLNGGSSRFACYAGTQQAIQLYVELDTSPYFTVNTTSVYLGNRGSQQLSLTAHNGATDSVTWSSNNALVSVSPNSGLSTTVTAAESGTGDATITATFASGDYDPIEVIVTVMELDTYVNIGVTTFTKVTSAPAGGWAGTYLLVDETANIIFNGSASPLGAGSEKEISAPVNSQIAATSDLISSSFNIKVSTNGYTLKSNSNYFVGNRSAENGIMTSLGIAYEVSLSVDSNKPIITALLEDGESSSTTLRHNASSNIFRFYTGSTGNDVALYKANGEVRAISSTLTDFYDAVKSNEYLVCNNDPSKSKVDFESMIDLDEFDALTTEDFDTLKRMSAKSAEDNGNYLEDFVSDYDYLVQYKGATDIFDRFAEGGAMYNESRYVPSQLFSNSTNTVTIIIVVSIVSLTAVGGYFLLKKKKEQ